MGLLPGTRVLTSSFGAQAAVSLHLLTQVQADIPVILIDTGLNQAVYKGRPSLLAIYPDGTLTVY